MLAREFKEDIVCMKLCMYVCSYVCMFVPMQLCMYVCLYICCYVYKYVYTHVVMFVRVYMYARGAENGYLQFQMFKKKDWQRMYECDKERLREFLFLCEKQSR